MLEDGLAVCQAENAIYRVHEASEPQHLEHETTAEAVVAD
jgi:hypothetical protein